MCEPKHGVFSKLHRLTSEPIEGADQALEQIRKYGYDVIDAPTERRGSVGSDYRGGSVSPYRASTPEARRESLNRYSPDSCYSCGGQNTGSLGRRGSKGSKLAPPEPRRSSMGNSPIHMRRTPPGKSPLASPRNSRYVKSYNSYREESMRSPVYMAFISP